ncbi:hypothetical protein [Bartonella phoceensis]|uniref:hypothetical protein n=1 Tax=Bartonella phoceensis TaxID=270249 RepID=UPI001ABAEBB5|nr:hypothetical protein [Bartonella phoceensis]
MGGKVDKKRSDKNTEFTESEIQLLHEIINTYQGMKIISRCMKWVVFIIFLVVVDFAHLIDAIDDIYVHLKQWFSKN